MSLRHGAIGGAPWENVPQSCGRNSDEFADGFSVASRVTKHRDTEGEGEQGGASGPVETGGRGDDARDDEAADAPVGAIAVTTFLAITILVFWFGMYFLNIARSS